MFYWFSYFIFYWLGEIFSPRVVYGKENLPPKGGFIIASNHISNLDPLLVGLSVGRRISYMAKDALFRNPVLRFCLNRVEAFPVKRDTADVRALRDALRRLKRGLPVLVFPEGTRGGTGKEKKTQSGIGFLALKSGVPVVPVHIGGSDRVLPPGRKFPQRGHVAVRFGKPTLFSDGRTYEEIVCAIMDDIELLSHAV